MLSERLLSACRLATILLVHYLFLVINAVCLRFWIPLNCEAGYPFDPFRLAYYHVSVARTIAIGNIVLIRRTAPRVLVIAEEMTCR